MPKPAIETNRRRVVARPEREGWIERHGGEDDIYIHTARPGRIIAVPPHRTLSPGVARKIAKEAGWL